MIPAARQACSTRAVGAMAERSRATSLPRAAPKPPGSRKSRCMSMITSAALAGSKANRYGSAAIDCMLASWAESLRREQRLFRPAADAAAVTGPVPIRLLKQQEQGQAAPAQAPGGVALRRYSA